MPIQLIPASSRNAERLALLQLLGETVNQGVANYQGYQQQQKADAERQALADLLAGTPGQGPKALNPGATGEQNALAAALSGGPAVQGPPTAPTPGLLPGVSPEQARAYVAAGAGGELLKVGLDRAYPKPVDPLDQARIDIARQGLDLDRQGMQLRRDQFASDQEFQRAKLALDERALAQDASTAGQAKLSDIGSFRGQFTGLSEDFIATRDAYGKLRSAVQDPSAAGDVALISGFMKMIDPTSVVREGEYATAANAAGIPEQIRGYWNRLVNGERLTAEQRTDFARQGHGIFQSQLQQQEQLQGAYRGIAQRTMPNVDPGDAIPDFIGTAREWQPIIGQPTPTEAASPIGPAMGAAQETFEDLVTRYALPPRDC